MRDIPIKTPETLKDFQNLAARFATNPGGLQVALLALVARGWSPNDPLDQHYLPLHDALLRRNTPLVMALLDVGADPMRCQPPGDTSLLAQAVIWDEVSVVKAMLKTPTANPVAKVKGQTLLHVAAQNGSIGMMEVLVGAGVDPWEPNGEGATAYDALAKEHGSHATQWGVYLEFAKQLKRLRADALLERLSERLADPDPETAQRPKPRM